MSLPTDHMHDAADPTSHPKDQKRDRTEPTTRQAERKHDLKGLMPHQKDQWLDKRTGNIAQKD
jgi:hypothetical protein